jgi:hypothetical protein
VLIRGRLTSELARALGITENGVNAVTHPREDDPADALLDVAEKSRPGTPAPLAPGQKLTCIGSSSGA